MRIFGQRTDEGQIAYEKKELRRLYDKMLILNVEIVNIRDRNFDEEIKQLEPAIKSDQEAYAKMMTKKVDEKELWIKSMIEQGTRRQSGGHLTLSIRQTEKLRWYDKQEIMLQERINRNLMLLKSLRKQRDEKDARITQLEEDLEKVLNKINKEQLIAESRRKAA